MKTLTGKVAVVTGGGRGLGAAICRTLCAADARVIAVDLRKELLGSLARDMCSRGDIVEPAVADIADEHQVAALMRRVEGTHGKLDILVNNAGIDVTLPVDELSTADWDRVLAVNLRAPFIMSKYALPLMKRQGSGHIVNVASTAAKRTWANASAYHASKWGLLGFSHALHVEARPSNIKVTAIVTGGMRTPFLLERFPDIDVTTLQDPANVAETVRFVLLQPDETVIPEMMVIPMRETSWP